MLSIPCEEKRCVWRQGDIFHIRAPSHVLFYCYPRRNDINFVSWRLLGNLRMFVSLHRRLHVARRSSRVPLSLPGRLLVAVGSELVFRIAHAAGAGARARNLSSHIEEHSTKLASIR